MSHGVGRRLKAIAILLFLTVLLLAAFAGTAANKAEARASLRGDVTTPPGSWEPIGFNVTGTAANFVTTTLGWNATRIGGNVGIGDGSMSALNSVGNTKNLDFTVDQYFMTGDVTTAPWNPDRIDRINEPSAIEAGAKERGANNTTAASNETTGDESGRFRVVDTGAGNITLTIPRRDVDVNDGDFFGENTSESEPVSEPPSRTGNIGRPMELNDPYHSILLGRPVNDLMYEGPLVQGTMYFRLVGLRVPDGSYASVGMRSLTYGY